MCRMCSVGVAGHQCVHGMSSVGVVCPQWGWHVPVSVSSVCVSMASVGVAWPQWMWHCLSGCDIASVGVA